MDKKELQKICGYLPYGLKMYAPNGFRPNGKESTGVHRVVYLTGDLYADLENNTYQGEVFRPILRPMSDIDTAQFNELRKITPRIEIGTYIWFSGAVSLKLAKEVETWLYRNHFDIHGLIQAGLAIDLNTLNTK